MSRRPGENRVAPGSRSTANTSSTGSSALSPDSPDGVFVMVDTKFSSRLERNIGDPLAALGYATSLMYCTTTSLAEGGAALGLMWGTELASEMLAAAGFGRVDILGSPRPQNAIYVCGREKMS